MTIARQIGTVELLRFRVYPIDPRNPYGAEACVDPGTFPVYSDGDTYSWVMTGHVNGAGVRQIGDGLFEVNPNDTPTEREVQFASRTFGRDEFAELLADPVCQEGPAQRLRFHLDEQAAA